jgi:hypothetical protein
MYYMFVVRIGRSLFLSLGYEEEVKALDKMIYETLEKPLKAPFVAIIEAFYNPRFYFTKKAYTRIGDSVDYVEVTRWDMRLRMEKIKDYVYDRATRMSSQIRFTKNNQGMVA